MTRSPLPACATCGRSLDAEDTVTLTGRSLTHANCQRPGALTAEERLLIATYCWDHPIAKCETCGRSYRLPELVAAPVDGEAYFCPFCRQDLIASVRAHLYTCTILPTHVRSRATAARDTARLLLKRFHELADAGDVLRRQTETAVEALREAMRSAPGTHTRSRSTDDPPGKPKDT